MSDETWLDAIRRILERYDEALLRRVATRLFKPRNQWPAEELIAKSLATLENPAVVDRRLKELPAIVRRVLAAVRQSGQMRWPIASLCEIAALLGETTGHEPFAELIHSGLAFPVLDERGAFKYVDAWLMQATVPTLLLPPGVTSRLETEDVELQSALASTSIAGPIHEGDGLDWPLRLAVLRQITRDAPLRRTQSREFFKRDLDRLRADALLGTPPSGAVEAVPDPELFAVSLALALGVMTDREGEVGWVGLPETWPVGLAAAIAEIWAALPKMSDWTPASGWAIGERPTQPFASAHLVAMVLIGQAPAERWIRVDAIADLIAKRHPAFTAKETRETARTGVIRFISGVAASLRLVQLAQAEGEWLVRLSPLGRFALGLGGSVSFPSFQQTLLVQPNLEILAYRQGLTPELIARLGNFATWKTLGAACTLQFEPSSVYHALEHGDSLESIVQTLDSHGMKPTPTPVLDALKTWANKRDRITVYPAAALFEFASPADLNEALSRGLPAVKITDRLAIVPREQDIDYKHFRLTGTRDFCLPPEKCVEVESDGVTLNVDLARSDLLLDTELMRFAEPHPRTPAPGRKLYRVTPTTLQTARQQAMSLANLEAWFEQRTGLPASPAVRFLFHAKETPSVEIRRQVVVHVASAETADGLLQWPATHGLIQARLGPMALAVAEENLDPLVAVLKEIGVTAQFEG